MVFFQQRHQCTGHSGSIPNILLGRLHTPLGMAGEPVEILCRLLPGRSEEQVFQFLLGDRYNLHPEAVFVVSGVGGVADHPGFRLPDFQNRCSVYVAVCFQNPKLFP